MYTAIGIMQFMLACGKRANFLAPLLSFYTCKQASFSNLSSNRDCSSNVKVFTKQC
jgi:hypothetical protein